MRTPYTAPRPVAAPQPTNGIHSLPRLTAAAEREAIAASMAKLDKMLADTHALIEKIPAS